MSPRLSTLFADLDACCRGAVPIDVLCDRLSRLPLSLEDVRDHVRFGEDGYRRNLVHLGPSYAALVLCWRPGQASPIHDHLGSACALRVIEGTGTETRFERRADGTLVEAGTHTYACHRVCGTYDADIHTVSNAQPPGHDLVTLHIYTPPMRQYRIYSRDSREYVVRDDIEILSAMRRQALTAGVPGA